MVQDLDSEVKDLELVGEPERFRVAGCGCRVDAVQGYLAHQKL